MRKVLLLTICVLLSSVAVGRTNAVAVEPEWNYGSMHQWRAHPAYSSINTIVVMQEKVYALSTPSLFSVDKQSESITNYSRLVGLNGAVITNIAYNLSLDLLLVCYENGQLDVINSKEEIDNIPDLYLKQANFSKIVNGVYMHGHMAYLAMDFGVMLLDMKRREIKDTYFIGNEASEIEVEYITIMGDSIYALSPNMLYSASLSDPLSDYAYWHSYPLPRGKVVSGFCAHEGQLYMVRDTVLWSQNEGQWRELSTDYAVRGLCQTGNELFILPKDTEGVARIGSDLSLQLQDLGIITAIQQDGNFYWFASLSHGLIRGKDMTFFRPEGPINSTAYRMRFFGDRLYVVPGGRWAVQNLTPGEIMYYENGMWVNISNFHLNASTGTNILDLMNVAQDPYDKNHYFVTSYCSGLLEMYDLEVLNLYTTGNSKLQTEVPSRPELYTRTDGAMYDDLGNLWFFNAGGNMNNIHIITPDKQWVSYNVSYQGKDVPLYTPGEIMVDRRNLQWKWIPVCRYNPGLILLQDNGTPTNPQDDYVTYRQSWVDQNNNSISPVSIYTIAQDYDNTIWVGSNNGIILIPSSVDFTVSNRCERVVIGRNDGTQLGDYLLENEQVNSIVVDGANRKWIGTATSGVFLLSPDGTETIEHFTAENSPLPSDNVLSIAIHESTGEVYFGTSEGLVSYMSDAVSPADNFRELYAYPNPVQSNYMGMVVIKGVMGNTEVRIVDASGNLVTTIPSNGGEAVWDLTNAAGGRVASGIYTAICNTLDGNASSSVKVMVIH